MAELDGYLIGNNRTLLNVLQASYALGLLHFQRVTYVQQRLRPGISCRKRAGIDVLTFRVTTEENSKVYPIELTVVAALNHLCKRVEGEERLASRIVKYRCLAGT